MIELKSKLADYIQALKASGACGPVVDWHDAVLKEHPEYTVEDLGHLFTNKEDFDDGWAFWVFELMGKEMAEDFRLYTIGLIKSPKWCVELLQTCDYFSEKEHALLKAKYTGKLPTVEKEIWDGKVVLQTAKAVGVKG